MKAQKEIKVLALFDYNSVTGFATVSKNLVKNWVAYFGKNLKLDICAINYFGDDYEEHDGNTRIISAKNKDVQKDDFGRYVFLRTLKDGDYDLIFILQDLGVIMPCIKFMKEMQDEKRSKGQKVFKSMFYFPVDFALTPNLGKGLDFFDFLATFTEYGKTQVLKINSKVEDKKKKLHVINHGNNMEDFYYIEDRDKVKKFRNEYFGKNSNKFIITNINRNQSRKDFPTTIFGFLEYWEEYNKNSFLYLHCHPKDPMGWDLRTILSQTPLKEGIDYMFPIGIDDGKYADVETLCNIYNASDVYLTTATGGGWELPVTEAMACKLPTIVPNHTSLQELGGKGERAYMLDTLYPIVAMVDNIIRFQSDLYEISETIDFVKSEKESQTDNYTNRIEKAYDFVNGLDWETISKKFISGMERLTN